MDKKNYIVAIDIGSSEVVVAVGSLAEGGVAVDTLVAGIEEGRRSFRIHRKKPDGKSYARDIANKYGLSHESIMKKINR